LIESLQTALSYPLTHSPTSSRFSNELFVETIDRNFPKKILGEINRLGLKRGSISIIGLKGVWIVPSKRRLMFKFDWDPFWNFQDELSWVG
jgi:hypothetical protein